ncbi:MAG: hypothetical protein ACJAVK_000253 [Akkermansiaceae bacterium]|jgi:hypothetical protein
MPQEDLVEFFRSKDPGALKHVMTVLDEAAIAHQAISEEGGFDFTSIGSGEDFEAFINIRTSDHTAARDALEADSLKADLPANHHLLHSSDEELMEVITHASEWSAFDVAHARRLLTERGVDSTKLEEDRAKRIARLKKGKPASKKLIFFGWVFSLLGGFMGIAVAWSLCQMKDKTPDGEYHRYDQASRQTGETMFKVAAVILVITLLVRFVLVSD